MADRVLGGGDELCRVPHLVALINCKLYGLRYVCLMCDPAYTSRYPTGRGIAEHFRHGHNLTVMGMRPDDAKNETLEGVTTRQWKPWEKWKRDFGARRSRKSEEFVETYKSRSKRSSATEVGRRSRGADDDRANIEKRARIAEVGSTHIAGGNLSPTRRAEGLAIPSVTNKGGEYDDVPVLSPVSPGPLVSLEPPLATPDAVRRCEDLSQPGDEDRRSVVPERLFVNITKLRPNSAVEVADHETAANRAGLANLVVNNATEGGEDRRKVEISEESTTIRVGMRSALLKCKAGCNPEAGISESAAMVGKDLTLNSKAKIGPETGVREPTVIEASVQEVSEEPPVAGDSEESTCVNQGIQSSGAFVAEGNQATLGQTTGSGPVSGVLPTSSRDTTAIGGNNHIVSQGSVSGHIEVSPGIFIQGTFRHQPNPYAEVAARQARGEVREFRIVGPYPYDVTFESLDVFGVRQTNWYYVWSMHRQISESAAQLLRQGNLTEESLMGTVLAQNGFMAREMIAPLVRDLVWLAHLRGPYS